MDVKKYFGMLRKDVDKAYDTAVSARKKGLDPVDTVEVILTESMAERVEGLIDILKFGYGETKRFAEIFPQYLIETGQEPHNGLVTHMGWLLSHQVITNPQQQEKFRKRLEEEVLIQD